MCSAGLTTQVGLAEYSMPESVPADWAAKIP